MVSNSSKAPDSSSSDALKVSIRKFFYKFGMNVQLLTPRLISQLVDSGHVTKISDMYRLNPYVLFFMDNMTWARVDAVLVAIDTSRSLSLRRFLMGLKIPGVTSTQIWWLRDRFTPHDFIAMKNYPFVLAPETLVWLTENRAYLKELVETIYGPAPKKFREKVEPAQPKPRYVLTRKRVLLDRSIDAPTYGKLKRFLKASDARLVVKLTKHTDLLIVSSVTDPETYQKAMDLGVRVEMCSTFEVLYRDNAIRLTQ